MHRRSRHFNPGHAGATCALDARYLPGISGGGTVTTWTPRTGTGPTQATAGNRPTFTLAGIGGSHSVTFGASRSLGWATSPISGATSASVVTASSRSSNAGGALLTRFGSPGLADHSPWTDGSYYMGTASTTRKAFVAPTGISVPVVESVESQSNSWIWRANGATAFSATTNTVGIGATPSLSGSINFAADWLGSVGAVATFSSVLSSSLLKRVCHHFAFSFKIAHS
jgi:hypothetical protein